MADKEKLSLLQKIKALMAKADHGSTEEEAALFMGKAMELLAKHNLEMSEVDALGEAGAFKIVEDSLYSNGGEMSLKWATWLGQATAKLYFCRYVINRTTIRRPSGSVNWTGIYHKFIGRRDNVDACKDVIEYLVSSVFVLAREAARKSGLKGKDRARYERDFREGASNRLYYRAVDIAAKAATGDYSATLPAVIKLQETTAAENEAFIKANLKIKTAVSRHTKYGVGFGHGAAAAENVSLNSRGKKVDESRKLEHRANV